MAFGADPWVAIVVSLARAWQRTWARIPWPLLRQVRLVWPLPRVVVDSVVLGGCIAVCARGVWGCPFVPCVCCPQFVYRQRCVWRACLWLMRCHRSCCTQRARCPCCSRQYVCMQLCFIVTGGFICCVGVIRDIVARVVRLLWLPASVCIAIVF